MTMTNDRPDLSSDEAPAIDKTIRVNVNRNKYPVVRPTWALKPGLTDRLVLGRNVTLTLTCYAQTVFTFWTTIVLYRPTCVCVMLMKFNLKSQRCGRYFELELTRMAEDVVTFPKFECSIETTIGRANFGKGLLPWRVFVAGQSHYQKKPRRIPRESLCGSSEKRSHRILENCFSFPNTRAVH
jgi:hypothetical protein